MRTRITHSAYGALLVCTSVLAACQQPPPPQPLRLEVEFLPQRLSVANLELTAATLVVDHVQPIGDSPPDMPPAPVPLTVDALSTTGASLEFDHAPPGVYSQVQFSIDSVAMQGSWRGTPLSVQIDKFGGQQLDIASMDGHLLGPGQDVTLVVDVDVTSWFGDDVLDQAAAMGGTITCNGQDNMPVTMQLSMHVNQSFTLQ